VVIALYSNDFYSDTQGTQTPTSWTATNSTRGTFPSVVIQLRGIQAATNTSSWIYEEIEALKQDIEAYKKTREWVRQRTWAAQMELCRQHSNYRPPTRTEPKVCYAPRPTSKRRSVKATRNWRRQR
jgi:hypothetical protein